MPDPVRFSVLICTYNRHELLDVALKSVVDGTQEKPDEVVVVNGGDERADEVVRRYMDRPGVEVRLVKTVNVNLANSRNIGLAECTGDIIAMTDDDAEVLPDWVTTMKAAHAEHPEAGAVGGAVIGTNTDSLVGKVADAITFYASDKAGYVRTLAGVNVSYKKEAAAKVGKQDITLFRGEDVDYNWRLIQLGYKVYYDPRIRVYHFHRPTLRGFLNQHYMYGRAYYLVRKKWPDMYCVYPRGFHRWRDALKAGNFVLSTVYQPVLSARKVQPVWMRPLAVPLLFTAGIAWKGGMILQGLRGK